MAQTAIAGAHRDAAYSPLTDAVLIKRYERVIEPGGFHCGELWHAAVEGAAPAQGGGAVALLVGGQGAVRNRAALVDDI